MHRAPLHPGPLRSSALLPTHAPCLTSPCLAVLLLSASHAHTVPRFTLPPCAPLCFTHTPRPSPLSHWLLRTLLPSHAPCSASPCLAVSRSASNRCLDPHFALSHHVPSVCFRHMHRPSLHPASLSCARCQTHASLLKSLSLAVFSSASHTRSVLHITASPCPAQLLTHAHILASPSRCLIRSASHTCLRASCHPAWLYSAQCLTHGPNPHFTLLGCYPPHTPCHQPSCLAVPPSASHTCLVPRYTLPGCSAPPNSDKYHVSFHCASSCFPLRLTHVPCFISHCLTCVNVIV